MRMTHAQMEMDDYSSRINYIIYCSIDYESSVFPDDIDPGDLLSTNDALKPYTYQCSDFSIKVHLPWIIC